MKQNDKQHTIENKNGLPTRFLNRKEVTPKNKNERHQTIERKDDLLNRFLKIQGTMLGKYIKLKDNK